MKVVINKCFGGFGLSPKAKARLQELGEERYERDIERQNPKLIQVVEELGDEANGDFAELAIVEIPDGIEWFIHEYDGSEHIAEQHRTWS